MKDSSGSNSSSPINPSSQSPAGSPSRSRGTSATGGGQSHRKNASGHQISLPSINAPPPSVSSNLNPHSALNPNAGGFLPGTLGPIHDMMDEGLITPTASRFDLMTGLPNSPNNGNGFPLPQQQQQNTSLFEDPSPFRGGGGGFTVNAVSPTSAFPAQQSLQQQQQYLQMQAQQQFELQRQLAQLGGSVGGGNGVGGFAAQMGGGSNGANATELIAEQMAIQQQLASLKLQQESLMARFGDMQANLVQVTQQQGQDSSTSPRIGSTGSQNQHRRVPSNQGSGAMGQFGQGGQFGQPIQPQPQVGKQAHARRISVPTTAGPPSSQSQSPPIGSNSRGGFAGSTGGFTFGSSGGQGQSQNQSQNQQGGFTFPPNNRSQQQQRNDEVEYGGWGENSPGQGRGGGHHRKQSGSVSSLGGWTWTPSTLFLLVISFLSAGTDGSVDLVQINRTPRILPRRNLTFSNSRLTEPLPDTLESLLSECRKSVPEVREVPDNWRWQVTVEEFPNLAFIKVEEATTTR